mmetsp:Transcript_24047/g.42735  ORF Transcript_24047/g.42735 Transcript_24047/m.42735 type:complete len:143 (+) Transcript_24047:2045-2473(+)
MRYSDEAEEILPILERAEVQTKLESSEREEGSSEGIISKERSKEEGYSTVLECIQMISAMKEYIQDNTDVVTKLDDQCTNIALNIEGSQRNFERTLAQRLLDAFRGLKQYHTRFKAELETFKGRLARLEASTSSRVLEDPSR